MRDTEPEEGEFTGLTTVTMQMESLLMDCVRVPRAPERESVTSPPATDVTGAFAKSVEVEIQKDTSVAKFAILSLGERFNRPKLEPIAVRLTDPVGGKFTRTTVVRKMLS